MIKFKANVNDMKIMANQAVSVLLKKGEGGHEKKTQVRLRLQHHMVMTAYMELDA